MLVATYAITAGMTVTAMAQTGAPVPKDYRRSLRLAEGLVDPSEQPPTARCA